MLWLIILIGIVFRVISLNQSLWLDEATSVLVARNLSFADIVNKFSPGDFHPPLYYFLLKIWIGVFGATEVGARSLSVVLGSATIPVVFLIGRKLLGKETGLIAALFFATAPLHIYYSQEARMYTPATFFAAVFVLFFLRVQEKKTALFDWVGLTISAIFAFYTHYLTLTLFLVFLLYLIFNKNHLKKDFSKWVIFFVLIILSFAPWLPIFSQQIQNSALAKINAPHWWKVLGKTDFKQLALVPVKFLIGRISSYDKVFYALSVSFPLLLTAFLFIKSVLTIKKTLLIWLWFFVPVVVSAFFGWGFSGFSYFRLLFVLPAFYLILAFGVFSIKSLILRSGLVLVLTLSNIVASSIYLLNPRFHREDWREAVRFIEERSRGKSAASFFVTGNQRDPYQYYSEGYVRSYGSEGLTKGPFTTIWLFRYVQPIFDPDDALRRELEKRGYTKRIEYDFNGIVVWKYVLEP